MVPRLVTQCVSCSVEKSGHRCYTCCFHSSVNRFIVTSRHGIFSVPYVVVADLSFLLQFTSGPSHFHCSSRSCFLLSFFSSRADPRCVSAASLKSEHRHGRPRVRLLLCGATPVALLLSSLFRPLAASFSRCRCLGPASCGRRLGRLALRRSSLLRLSHASSVIGHWLALSRSVILTPWLVMFEALALGDLQRGCVVDR